MIYTAFLALGAVTFFIGIQQPLATAPDPRTGNVMALVSGFTWSLALMGLRWVQWGDDDPVGAAGATVVCGNVHRVPGRDCRRRCRSARFNRPTSWCSSTWGCSRSAPPTR